MSSDNAVCLPSKKPSPARALARIEVALLGLLQHPVHWHNKPQKLSETRHGHCPRPCLVPLELQPLLQWHVGLSISNLPPQWGCYCLHFQFMTYLAEGSTYVLLLLLFTPLIYAMFDRGSTSIWTLTSNVETFS